MKMKKLSSIMVAFAASVMMLTSCLEGGRGGTSSGAYFGVMGTINSTTPVVYVNNNPIYSTLLRQDYLVGNLYDKDCIYFTYEIDQGSEENADASTKGYITATIGGWTKLPKAAYVPYFQDTTQVLNAETAFYNVTPSSYFSQNILFVNTAFSEYFQDQENTYTISFDTNTEPTEVNGERIYEVYLRSVIKDPGKTSSSSYKNDGPYIGIDLDAFLKYAYRKEESANKENVYMKFKYPTAFEEDSTGIKTWNTSEKLTFAIPQEY